MFCLWLKNITKISCIYKHSFSPLRPPQVVNSDKVEPVPVPCLLPHEVLHAVACAGSKQVWLPHGFFNFCCTFVMLRDEEGATSSTANNQPCQFEKTFFGRRSKESVAQLWSHCLRLDEWKQHPAFKGVPENDWWRRGPSKFFFAEGIPYKDFLPINGGLMFCFWIPRLYTIQFSHRWSRILPKQ